MYVYKIINRIFTLMLQSPLGINLRPRKVFKVGFSKMDKYEEMFEENLV